MVSIVVRRVKENPEISRRKLTKTGGALIAATGNHPFPLAIL